MKARLQGSDGLVCEVGSSSSGLGTVELRPVRSVITPQLGDLHLAENDLQTAQSEPDPHRQSQYARAAADAAAEAAMSDGASSHDRERALAVIRSALALIPGCLLREAQATLTAARDETDPQRQRKLARSAQTTARDAMAYRDVTNDERAQGRHVIRAAQIIVRTNTQTVHGHR